MDSQTVEQGITEISHQRFVDEVLKDFNVKAAYQRIRPEVTEKSAEALGSKMLRNIKVQELIAQRIKQLTESTDTHVIKALTEARRIAFSNIKQLFDDDGKLKDIKDIPDEAAACIASIEIETLYEGRGEGRIPIGTTRKVKLWDKNSALDKLFKYHALYKELGSKDNPLTFNHIVDVRHLSNDELREHRRATEGLLASTN